MFCVTNAEPIHKSRKVLATVPAAPDSGYMLQNTNFGLNQLLTTHEDNIINVNMGQASSQCSGKGCSGGATFSQTFEQRIAPSSSRASNSNLGGTNVVNLDTNNDIWLKSGKSASQCAGKGCKAVSQDDATIDSSSRLMMPEESSRAFENPMVTIYLEDLNLGQGNIINIGDSSSDSISVGDGVTQCVGKGCYSSSEKSWKVGSTNARGIQLLPSSLNSLDGFKDPKSQNYTITLKNLFLSQGNIINIGNENILSINIGDGASQCVGDKCTSISEKRSSYSARAIQASSANNSTQAYDGFIQGASNYPFTLVFRNVTLGNANIINVGNFNGNGITTGENVAQCIGAYCHSIISAEFTVINSNSSSNDTVSRGFTPVEGDARWSLRKPSFFEDTPFPFVLSQLYLGEANILNFGRKNIISINIGDGASQCVGNKCVSKALRAGDVDAAQKASGGSGGADDPMSPSNVKAKDVSNITATITWKDASADPPDVSYTVNCVQGTTTKCEDNGIEVSNIPHKVETATVTGLLPNTTYECWVKMVSTILNTRCSKDPATVTTSA